jgi:hypothetical protein
MSVSSVSGYSSTLWEEYLEQIKKRQQQENSVTAPGSFSTDAGTSQSGLSPIEIISELESLRDDPEKLKARAAELAAETAEEAGSAVGIRAKMLDELTSDLETVAESGDLSAMREKLARRPNGAVGVSSKLTEALIEEEEDEDTSATTLESVKALLAEIQKLIEEESANSPVHTASGLTPGRQPGVRASEFQEAGTSIGFGAIVSKFQAITETRSAAETSDTSAGTLISKLKYNLTDQLRALYAQGGGDISSVSLSG